MSTLERLLRAVFRVFCGTSGSPEPSSEQQPQKPTQPVPVAQHTQQHQKPQYQKPHGQQKPEHDPSSAGYPPSKPSSPRPQQSKITHGQRVDLNQLNQRNEHYTSLRARANEEGDKMASCFDRSHDAYSRGDGALAKKLSNEGKEHKSRMEELNKQASDWIYRENNLDSGPGEIDLHGLYVKESIFRTERAIQDARQRGDSTVHLIVGQGLHSPGGIAKIKPAIEELMHKENLVAELDPHNSGVLIVHLDGQSSNRGIGSDEIARRLQKDDEGCTIM